MSLSEAPKVEITHLTPPNISDEILGATLTFCRETGYKQNIAMITFFWTAFLHTIKEELLQDDLISKVMRHYTISLTSIFPQLSSDTAMKTKVEEMMQYYWQNISNDFNDISKEPELSKFINIANSINSQDDGSSSYLLIADPREKFKQISSNISSSIYRLLRNINNGIGIEYRGIIQRAYIHDIVSSFENKQSSRTTFKNPYNSIPQQTPSNTQQQYNSNYQNQNNEKSILVKFLWFFIAFIVLVAIIANLSEEETDSISITEPSSGTILIGSEDYYGSKITVSASGGESSVVKLKTVSGVTRLSFYVRSGDTVTISVPAEFLYVYFASGETWYGENDLFGEYTSYSMDENLCDFSSYTYEYTLYPVTNGNFSQTPIDEDEF